MKSVLMAIVFLLCATELSGRHDYRYEHELAVCAVFRDEAPYLKEWIEFHRLVGVEKFYLYNNLSQDGYREILAPYVKKGIVTLIEWPHDYQDVGRWSGIQCGAYDDCLDKVKGTIRWVAFLDLDEFLFPVQGENLQQFLKDYRKFGAVAVNWQLYGTGGVTKIPEGKLLIEALLYKGEVNYKDNCHVKSIVQPLHVQRALGPHNFLFIKKSYQVNSSKTRFEGPWSPSILVDKIRINHYWSRDEAFFYGVKIPRRQAWQEGLEGVLKRNVEISKVYDDSIVRFAPKLKKRL